MPSSLLPIKDRCHFVCAGVDMSQVKKEIRNVRNSCVPGQAIEENNLSCANMIMSLL